MANGSPNVRPTGERMNFSVHSSTPWRAISQSICKWPRNLSPPRRPRHSFLPSNYRTRYAAVKVGGRRNGLICAAEYFIAHDQTLITLLSLSLSLSVSLSVSSALHSPPRATNNVCKLNEPVHPTKKWQSVRPNIDSAWKLCNVIVHYLRTSSVFQHVDGIFTQFLSKTILMIRG